MKILVDRKEYEETAEFVQLASIGYTSPLAWAIPMILAIYQEFGEYRNMALTKYREANQIKELIDLIDRFLVLPYDGTVD